MLLIITAKTIHIRESLESLGNFFLLGRSSVQGEKDASPHTDASLPGFLNQGYSSQCQQHFGSADRALSIDFLAFPVSLLHHKFFSSQLQALGSPFNLLSLTPRSAAFQDHKQHDIIVTEEGRVHASNLSQIVLRAPAWDSITMGQLAHFS